VVTAKATRVTKASAPKAKAVKAGTGQTPVRQTPAKDSSRRIAILAAQAGLEKKATGVEIIDVSGKVDYADYLVLMTGASDRNVAAIAQEVDAALSKAGVQSLAVEGLPAATWVLIDFVDVVVHVFLRDARSLYDLDGLWMDADRIGVAGDATSTRG
jgi:ribosome-associated protein